MDKLADIFYSNSRHHIDYDALDELEFLIKENILSFLCKKAFSLADYYNIIDKFNNHEIKHFDYQGGDIRHLALKFLGKEMLEDLKKDVKIENIFHNRYPDLISTDEKTIIECGDTDPTKIIDYFSLSVAKIIILPYPDSETENLSVYEFICDYQALLEYIMHKENYNKKKILSIIKRR